MRPLKFAPKDTVTWTSQAQGTHKEKKGIVVCVLEKNVSIDSAMKRHAGKVLSLDALAAVSSKPKGQSVSLVDRYLVAVARIGKTGKPTGAIDLYTPTVDMLHKNGKKVKA